MPKIEKVVFQNNGQNANRIGHINTYYYFCYEVIDGVNVLRVDLTKVEPVTTTTTTETLLEIYGARSQSACIARANILGITLTEVE